MSKIKKTEKLILDLKISDSVDVSYVSDLPFPFQIRQTWPHLQGSTIALSIQDLNRLILSLQEIKLEVDNYRNEVVK